MPVPTIGRPVSALRQRMMEDMPMRGLRSDTQHEYIRFVRSFAAFLGQPPDTATAEDIRRFQVDQRESGVQPALVRGSRPVDGGGECSDGWPRRRPDDRLAQSFRRRSRGNHAVQVQRKPPPQVSQG